MNARLHSGLNGYLLPATKTAVVAPNNNPRLPVAPAGALPTGPSPLPNTSQTNKKTNAQIVYARTAVNSTAFGGLNKTIAEGDVAFVERLTHPKRKLTQVEQGKMIRVYTMEQINTKFANTRVPTDSGKEIADFFSVDGVVNNLDGLDTHNEFRDHAIANTAIQGPCRLAVSAEEAKRVQIGDVLYIGLQATERDALDGEAEPTYKLELYRFFSSDVTRMKTGSAFAQQLDKTKRAWAVGRIIDSNQSHRMATIHVCIDQVQEITDAMLDMMMSEKRFAEIAREREVARYSETIDRQQQGVKDVIVLEMTVERPVKEQLLRRWRRAGQGR
jgi:hypothetical protein